MMENDDLLHDYRSWYSSTRRTGAVHELRGHRSPVNAVIAFGGPPPEDAAVFGPWVLQAPQLISASDDCTVKVWDAATGACMHTCSGHTARVVCLADIRGRHRVCVSGSYDWTLRSWDAAGGTCVAVMRGHGGEVNEVAAAGAGKVVSASDDGTLKVWDAGAGLCLHTLGDHGDYLVSVAQLCHSCVYVCAGYHMAAMTVWDRRDDDGNRWWVGDAGEGGTEGWQADKVVAIDGHMVLASAQETPSWYLTGRCRLRIWDVLYGYVGHIDCSGAEVALSSPEPGCALVACTHWAQPHTPVGGRLEVWDVHEQALLFAADTGARVPRGAAALGGGLVVACGDWEGGGLAVWSLATPRQEVAARQISRHWRRAISDPQRALCRKVLAHVYSQ